MSSLEFLTSGNIIKIWNFRDYNLTRQFALHSSFDELIVDASWSKDATRIATVTDKTASVYLSVVSGSTSSTALPEITGASSCCYSSSSSRYLAVGCKTGELCLWDNNNNKIVKRFKGDDTGVSRLTFCRGDSHLASGSRSGTVQLHNVTSGVVSRLDVPTASQSACVRDLRFSPCRASQLGAAFSSGHVCVWDVKRTGSAAPSRPFREPFHAAPATALCFSPVNTRFLVTAGLDKTLVCFDLTSHSVVKKQTCGAPVTSLDFSPDGRFLLVGTTRGRVEVYDLMNLGQPFNSFTCFDCSVSRILFPPNKSGGSKSAGDSVSVPDPVQINDRGQSERSPLTDRTANTCSASVVSTTQQSVLGSVSVDDVFSPVRDSMSDASSMMRNSVSLAAGCSPLTKSSAAAPPVCESSLGARGLSGSSLFSPVRQSVLLERSEIPPSPPPSAHVRSSMGGGGHRAAFSAVRHSTPDDLARASQLTHLASPVYPAVETGPAEPAVQAESWPADPVRNPGLPQQTAATPARPTQADRIEAAQADLKSHMFHTTWVAFQQIYEIKSDVKELTASVRSMQSDINFLKDYIQRL